MPTIAENTIIGLTADIVAAYLTKSPVDGADLPALIQSVYAGLVATLAPAKPETPALEPAVPVKRSVFPDGIVCLDCGRRMISLKRHLGADHSLSPAEYRARWGLPENYPIVAPNYAQRRSEIAKEAGLGRKPEPPPLTVDGITVKRIPANNRGRPRKGPVSR